MPVSEASELILGTMSRKDKAWDTHRLCADKVQSLYLAAQNDRYAERIQRCGQTLEFAFGTDDKKKIALTLRSAHFCRVRHCPVCQWRRSMKWTAKMFQAMPAVTAAYPTHRWMFLTLTVKNCAIADLRSKLADMNRAFERLTKLRSWPAIGWVKSVEVTRSETGEAHPHLHVLMLVPPGYFTGKGYIKQETWREAWKKCLRSDYLPVVNVKSIRAKNAPSDAQKEGTDSAIARAICETLKYAVKEADLVADADWLNQLTTQLHKTKAVSIGGILKGYMKDEREDDDLIHLDENGITVDAEEDPSIWFGWREAISHYVKVER